MHILTQNNRVVPTCQWYAGAEGAVKRLQRSGVDREKLAVVGHDDHAEEDVAGSPDAEGHMNYGHLLKHKTLAITFLTITAFAVGCKPSAQAPRKTTSEQFDTLNRKAKEAAQEIKDYAYAQKAVFVAKMQSQLEEINRDLDRLAASIESSSDAAKAKARPQLQALRDQTAKLIQQLDEARNADESAWEDVKGGFQKGYAQFLDAFQEARQWVSEKVAP